MAPRGRELGAARPLGYSTLVLLGYDYSAQLATAKCMANFVYADIDNAIVLSLLLRIGLGRISISTQGPAHDVTPWI